MLWCLTIDTIRCSAARIRRRTIFFLKKWRNILVRKKWINRVAYILVHTVLYVNMYGYIVRYVKNGIVSSRARKLFFLCRRSGRPFPWHPRFMDMDPPQRRRTRRMIANAIFCWRWWVVVVDIVLIFWHQYQRRGCSRSFARCALRPRALPFFIPDQTCVAIAAGGDSPNFGIVMMDLWYEP